MAATEISLSSPTSEAPLSDAVYEPYTPQRVKITGAKEHPGALVQSAAMASVLPPVPKYNLATPLKVVTEGRLSDAQLEAVVYAGHAHSAPFLPESDKLPERRRGFFIGDGTGVGKGREIAGIIQDNWERGTRKHIWVSEKQSLINDAKRDMQGVGLDPKKAFPHNGVKPADAIKASDGVVFTTYDTLKSSEKIKGVNEKGEKVSTKGKTRLQQIIDWVGEDFDGVIAFDEAHNLGNSMDTKANRGVKKAAAKALAGVALQNALPKARVVYVSATGATEVSNLSYAERLGLWGKGTAFANRDDFLSKVSSGGVAAMELVARDMKALGRYIARNLSYDGVEYDRVEHKLTPEQVQVYDKLATGWQLVLKNFNAAMEAAGITEEKEGGGSKTKNKDAKSAILSQFWGGHQRFFNQVITSMQLPTVLKAVERDIAEGRSAVLQLVNTNEAAQERALAKVKAEGDPEEIEDLDMTPRDQLMQLVSNAFPVNRFEDYTDESGNLRSRMVVDKDNKPVQDPKLVAAREALLDELGSIKVPDGPLEMLLNHFGTDKVSEVTGRKQRVVRKPDEKTGQMRTVVEKRPGSANVAEANLFQEGKKPILVFSEAGGTGVSYHADVNSGSANKRRSHYLVQAGWRADKAVQGFGRTHRTNQASAPLFHLVTTDLQGQKRFISSIARRLGQLGALTKGERRTGNQGMFGLRDNLESDEARDALKAFYNDVVADKIPGVSVTDLQDQMGLKILEEGTGRLLQQLPPMPQFLNRMLSLKTDLQNHVFNAFSARLDDVIDRAAAAGTLDTGVETYTADRIRKVGDQKVYTDQESGAETRHVHLVTETRNKPATYEQVVSRLRSANASKDAPFIRSKRSGKIFGVADSTDYTDKEGRIIEQKKLLGPLGYEFADSYKLNNEQYWEPVEDAKAEAAWGDQVKKIPEFAQADLHLITGAVLPIWDRLGGSPKIFRLQTDAGERMLGRVIPNDTVPATLKALGAEALKVNVAPAEMATAILDNGKRAELANGWVIKRSLVAGEPRLELVGPDYQFADQLKRDGVFSERIDWKTRFFIPTGEAAAVIERVTKGRPVTELSSGAAEKEEGSRFQRHAPGFFSTLNRAIDEVKLTRAPAKDWLGLIGNLVQKGVKKEELDWSGVRDWLAGQQGTVTKEAVQQHLRENEVQVQEVEKGAATRFTTEDVAALHDTLLAIEQNGDLGKGAADELMNGIERGEAGPIGEAEELGVPDEFISPFRDQDGGPTKFGTGQGKPLPGGENYRELLLTLPSPSWMYAGRRDAPSAEAMAKVFTSGHWHEPNVLAHVRFDTRTGPKGEKILHIAEVQSDWHQKGRKGGYAEKVTKDVAEQRGYSVYRAKSNLGTDAYFAKGPEFPRGVIPVNGHDTEAMAWDRLISSLQAYNDKSSVPNAPFKSSWHELAMKRMLRYAAENGYDKVTWDTGDTNTDRYDLAHVVDKIEVHPAGADHPGELLVQARKGGQLVAQQYTRPEKLADFIGKDAADRALSGGNKKRLDNGEAAILTGDDLKVGGKGMREFYDKILPQFMNKYAKKWGASVGEAKIPSAEAYWEPFQRADGKWSFRQKEGGAESAESFPTREAVVQALGKPVHSIDVTPAMREGVMKGQPLFQRERLAGERGQAPGTVRLAQDVVATLPHAPSPEEQSVIDQVGRIARQIVPKAEVVATRRLYAQGALAQGGEHDIAGATTRGARRLIAWSLASRDAAGTLRHEAIHWLKQNGFFHAKEWGVLERAAQTGNWMGKHNIMERYPDLGFEGQIEEAIAEQFAKWRQAPAGVPQVAKPLFERLAVLLGRVRDYLRQAFGHDTDADNVFSRIASGEVGSRTPPPPAPNRPPGSRETFGMSRFQEMEPEERDSRIAEGARALINVAEDLQMAIAPMARGSDTTKATVKDFSNLMRAARDFGLVQIDRLKKQFKPSQLKAMWEAADEQSIAAQQNRTPREGGLARLNDQERTAVADLQKDAQSVWNAMREAGQIEGEGIPHYVPHLYVEVGETGYKRLGSRGLRSIPGLGRNVTTTSPHLLHRKYLTAEEGVEAAAHKFGVTTAIVKDIRTLPMTTMRNREALAGYQLIQEIKNMGQRVGEDWVAEGSTPPGFFHVDHPAFYRWRPAFVTDEASGRVVPAKDQNGNMMWQKVPLSVREDWEGPLRAALTEPEGPVYRAFMDLKMRAMNNIMFSPLVQLHLLTELGRAFPAAPFKIASMKLMFEGNQAKNDQALRLRAVMAGLVPIGHRGAMQDITSVTSADNIRPGRSWTAQILGAVPGLFDVRAGDAVKRGIDRMGDLLHNTLLWDRVQDLQFGLFTTLSDWGRAKGLSQETADRMAAHMANRYAGTLPRESMSVFARKLSNELLFSRTYTLGNMGMMKDALGGFLGAPVQVVGRAVGRPDIGKGWGGLPMDIQAQIKRDAPEELAKVQGIARRKALSMLVLDVALMNVGMALVQNFFQWMSGESGDEIAKGYVARWQELEADAARNPFMVLNPIHDMMRLSPVFENERDPDTGLPLQRIFVGYDKQGTAIYARNPLGKYAEEIVGWTESPLVTLKSKLNALAVKPTLDVLANDRGFGRKVYLPTDNAAVIAAKIFAHYIEATLPMQQIDATRDLLMGKAKSTDAAQLLGRTVGVTFRHGAPGGPAVGLMYQVRAVHEAKVQEALPEIRQKIIDGKLEDARRDMQALGIPFGLQRYYIRTARNPNARLSAHAIRDFMRYASPEERAQMQRLRGANQ